MRYDDEIVQANIARLKEHPQGRNWCVGGNIHYAELIMASLLDDRTKLESQRDTLLPQAKAAHSAGHALGLPGGTDITVELVPAIHDLLTAQQDHQRLVRELDVLLNGEAGAAKQASLCDIVAQVAKDGVVAKAQSDATLAALQKYEEALDLLFGQCCSNGIFDAWGKRVNCTTLNEAHELAGKAIKTAVPAAKDNVWPNSLK